ncbi:hypothetical protein E4U33_007637 [Claviceps sp. LM78 group G4]|nr:hypothetical protein E4U33_007637 [Claviceps sp. LM78 group G4]
MLLLPTNFRAQGNEDGPIPCDRVSKRMFDLVGKPASRACWRMKRKDRDDGFAFWHRHSDLNYRLYGLPEEDTRNIVHLYDTRGERRAWATTRPHKPLKMKE